MRVRAAYVFLAAAMAVGGCSLLTPVGSRPVIVVPSGLAPQMNPEQVADLVLDQIHQMEAIVGKVATPARILRITATTRAGVSQLEPRAGQEQPAVPGIVWVVHAEGTFTTQRGLRDPAAPLPVATSGFYVISDADGGVLSFGFP